MKYSLRAITKKTALLTTAFVLAVSTFTAAVPFILSQEASAVAGYNYSGINLVPGNWVPDRAAPSGGYTVDVVNSRVLLTVNQNLSSSDPFKKTEGVSTSVAAGTTSLTGSFFIANDWATKSNLRVGLWGVTDAPVSWPIVEYAANVGGYTGWRVWNTVDGGWINVAAPTNVGGTNTVEVLLNTVQNKFNFYVNNTNVGSYGANGTQSFTNVILNSYNIGTNNSVDNYVVDWRNLKAGVAPQTTACTPTTVWNTDLTQWNGPSSDTRTNGHKELTAAGLHLYTDNNSGQAKVTGYRSVNYPLSANGSQTIAQSIDWTQEYGTVSGPGSASKEWTPGLQLVVDFDNNGTSDGILVGESVYGNSWWLSNGSQQFVKDNAPRSGGGYGSNWYGTVNEWLTSFPAARVKEVGFSLGSGVHAGGILNSMTFGCVTYKFDGTAPVAPQPYNPSNGGWNTNANGNFVWRNVSDADRYEVRYSSSPGRSPNVNDGELNGSDAVNFEATKSVGDFSNYNATSPLADGTWFWQVRALDAAGNKSAWSNIWSTKVDSNAPVAPIINNSPVYIGSSESNDQATWTHSGADVDHFEYREYMSLDAANADVDGNTASYWTQTKAASVRSQTVGQSWTGEKTLYYRVVAIDAAGNRSTPSALGTVIIDKNAPTVTLPADSGVVGGNNFEVRGTVRDNSGIDNYRYQILDENKNNLTGALESQGYSRAGGTTDVVDGVLVNVNTSALPEGTYHIRVWAFDKAGNRTGTKNVPHITKFVIDRTGPAVAITAPGDGAFVNGVVNISGTITDTRAFNSTYSVVGSGYSVSSASSTSSSHEFAWDTTGLNGLYTVTLTATDDLGNVSEKTISLFVDNTAPEVTVNAITPITAGQSALVTGTVDDPSVAEVSIYLGSSATPIDTATVVNGAFSFNITNLAVGTYQVTVKAVDALGNEGESVPRSVVVSAAPVQTGSTSDGAPTGEGDNAGAGTGQGTGTSTPAITDNLALAVLGVTTQPAAAVNGETKGATTDKAAQAVDADGNTTAWGLAWYWWLLIIAALATIAWWIAAAVRRRNAQES